MELNLQFGFGMMDHSRALISKWRGGNVILSPRDRTHDQLLKLSESIRSISGGSVWLDPQFYVPRADHERLCGHKFWPSNFQTGIFWEGAALNTLITELESLNAQLETQALVLPGILAGKLDDDWFAAQEAIIDEACGRPKNRPIIATIALSDDAIQSFDEIGDLIEAAEKWKVDGFYLVFQHPGGNYLVNDPTWVANVIDLAAGLKLSQRSVTIGYCNHQLLIAAVARVDAIASGTWMNVRSFPPEKFVSTLEDEIKQRSKWYYCPQALSEYKIPYLDIAQRHGLLNEMQAPAILDSQYADILFTGAQPTTVKAFSEQNAFRHYLHCLHSQVALASKPTFDETVDEQKKNLDVAERLLGRLRSKGITGQMRDFHEAVDANRAALELIVTIRGATLRRMWTQL
jgi:hypothetical protein